MLLLPLVAVARVASDVLAVVVAAAFIQLRRRLACGTEPDQPSHPSQTEPYRARPGQPTPSHASPSPHRTQIHTHTPALCVTAAFPFNSPFPLPAPPAPSPWATAAGVSCFLSTFRRCCPPSTWPSNQPSHRQPSAPSPSTSPSAYPFPQPTALALCLVVILLGFFCCSFVRFLFLFLSARCFLRCLRLGFEINFNGSHSFGFGVSVSAALLNFLVKFCAQSARDAVRGGDSIGAVRGVKIAQLAGIGWFRVLGLNAEGFEMVL